LVALSPMLVPWTVVNPGPLGGPMPPAAFRVPRPAPIAPRANPNPNPNPRRGDISKGEQYTTIGDRLFRAGNLKRASERYEQALRADPGAAAPRVRLAQLAMVRGQYAEAAQQLREAIAAEPGWLEKATDIRPVFGEPGDFNRPIAKLESHLLADPNDRDGWLLLGVEYYLSGRTRKAADVFLRLTDRKPDPALAALLDATGVRLPLAED
jgi:tetratricopeptide (TPR) repeat protein